MNILKGGKPSFVFVTMPPECVMNPSIVPGYFLCYYNSSRIRGPRRPEFNLPLYHLLRGLLMEIYTYGEISELKSKYHLITALKINSIPFYL